jgi:hypothetical protein
MYSGPTFSSDAFSDDSDFVALASSGFASFLARPQQRCWLLELDAFSLAALDTLSAGFSDASFGVLAFGQDGGVAGGGTVTLRYGSSGYITHAADSPAQTYYAPRLAGDLRIERKLIGRDGIGGLASVYAEASLINTDGALDLLEESYAIDGRGARLWLGAPDAALSTFGLVCAGRVGPYSADRDVARVAIWDLLHRLKQPIQTTTYAGTGGLEGGSDLEGKAKPICYGKAYNVAPPLVDTATLRYQVHDGAIHDVPAVRDRGVNLTKVGGAPAAGQYQVDVATGTFKLGATPSGTVTCDVEGDASLSGYTTTTAEIVRRILIQRAGCSSSEINSTSFDALVTDASASVGVWIGTEARNIDDVIDELLYGCGAFGGPSRLGEFTVGLIDAAAGMPVAVFDAVDTLDLARDALPATVDPIVWRVRVGWRKNFTVQNDLAAAAGTANVSFAAQPYRYAVVQDSALQSRHLAARELTIDALYTDEADAQAEAQRLFDLWSNGLRPYRVKTTLRGAICDLGQVVQLTHARFGFSAGRPARVLGQSIQTSGVELTVLA